MQHLPQSLTIIAKPTHECNLGCVYCYVGPTAERGRMSTETLEKMTLQACEVVGPEGVVDFLWHGGEPLAVGLDFYKTAVETQERVKGKTRVENSMQTNGTLLTEETGELARELNQVYGMKKRKPEENMKSIKDEVGDLLMTLICISNALGIDLDKAFDETMEKVEKRAVDRDNSRDKS